MADEGPVMLLCWRTDQRLGPDLIPGTEVRSCGACGAAVWVSPSGQRVLAAQPIAAIRCLECGPVGTYVAQPAPGALAEAREALSRWARARGR